MIELDGIADRATALARAIREGDVRASDVVDYFLGRVARVDGDLGAFLEVWDDSARQEAEGVDRARARGAPLGPLAGVPVAVKDVLVRKGFATTCGSRMLAHFRSPYTATAVERLERANAILLGRTNMDEFGMGSSTEHSAWQTTRNPFDRERVPGGSSGGSAVAVSAGMAPLALGSDTGGSVRQPAALCGVCGLKPTYGRISRYGLVAYASSLDHVGVIAADAPDLALLLSTLAGQDERDATSLDAPVPDYNAALTAPLAGTRIGVPEQLLGEGIDAEVAAAVRAALAVMREHGAQLVPVALPHVRYAIAAYYLIADAEASTNLARFDGVRYGERATQARDLDAMYAESRRAGFGDEVVLRIALGTFALSAGYYDAYYGKASKVRTLIRSDFERAFAQCDLVATPTSPMPAFPLGQRNDDPLQMYLCDALTVPANLAGLPALSVPCGATGPGLPIGLQFVAPPLAEGALLAAAHAYQAQTDHHRRRPLP